MSLEYPFLPSDQTFRAGLEDWLKRATDEINDNALTVVDLTANRPVAPRQGQQIWDKQANKLLTYIDSDWLDSAGTVS